MLAIGSPAEDFVLRNEQDEEVRLSDCRGRWVVLYFYPRDNTPGCTTEALEFSALCEEFENLDAMVLGISPDSCHSHNKFVIQHHLKIVLLSDPEKLVLAVYEAWGEKQMYGKVSHGVVRSTVLVDPQGHVAHHWPHVKARGHAAQVLAKLKELQAAG